MSKTPQPSYTKDGYRITHAVGCFGDESWLVYRVGKYDPISIHKTERAALAAVINCQHSSN
jgi:hypothetical protein